MEYFPSCIHSRPLEDFQHSQNIQLQHCKLHGTRKIGWSVELPARRNTRPRSVLSAVLPTTVCAYVGSVLEFVNWHWCMRRHNVPSLSFSEDNTAQWKRYHSWAPRFVSFSGGDFFVIFANTSHVPVPRERHARWKQNFSWCQLQLQPNYAMMKIKN